MDSLRLDSGFFSDFLSLNGRGKAREGKGREGK